MKTANTIAITIGATVNTPIEKVWEYWNEPVHITQWCAASDDWHTPRAENDLRPGGKLLTRMEAKDGSMGFDFEGIYDEVVTNQSIRYTLGDGRKVAIAFIPAGDQTRIVESFDAENMNPVEMQQAGWQAILDNFKTYAESR